MINVEKISIFDKANDEFISAEIAKAFYDIEDDLRKDLETAARLQADSIARAASFPADWW